MQDDEYLASLLADKEKETKALKEAESHYLKEDKACNKLLEEEVVYLLILAQCLQSYNYCHCMPGSRFHFFRMTLYLRVLSKIEVNSLVFRFA